MRIAFDSNVLLYPELEPRTDKADLSFRLIERCAGRVVVAAQALGELLAVVRRKMPEAFAEAVLQVKDYSDAFRVVATDAEVVIAAAAFADRYRLQFWDAVIWEASAKGGATILLTEDLQHGFTAGGMRAVNPYAMPDWPRLARELGIRG